MKLSSTIFVKLNLSHIINISGTTVLFIHRVEEVVLHSHVFNCIWWSLTLNQRRTKTLLSEGTYCSTGIVLIFFLPSRVKNLCYYWKWFVSFGFECFERVNTKALTCLWPTWAFFNLRMRDLVHVRWADGWRFCSTVIFCTLSALCWTRGGRVGRDGFLPLPLCTHLYVCKSCWD